MTGWPGGWRAECWAAAIPTVWSPAGETPGTRLQLQLRWEGTQPRPGWWLRAAGLSTPRGWSCAQGSRLLPVPTSSGWCGTVLGEKVAPYKGSKGLSDRGRAQSPTLPVPALSVAQGARARPQHHLWPRLWQGSLNICPNSKCLQKHRLSPSPPLRSQGSAALMGKFLLCSHSLENQLRSRNSWAGAASQSHGPSRGGPDQDLLSQNPVHLNLCNVTVRGIWQVCAQPHCS